MKIELSKPLMYFFICEEIASICHHFYNDNKSILEKTIWEDMTLIMYDYDSDTYEDIFHDWHGIR